MSEATHLEHLRDEFNRWAEAGRGEGMEQEHLPIVLPVLDRMGIEPDDNVLDLGCGAGWLSRLLSEQLPEGRVVGIDVSDEMIRRSRRRHSDLDNAMFVVGAAEEIPWDADFSRRRSPWSPRITGPTRRAVCEKFFACLREGGSPWVADQLLPRQSAFASVGRSAHHSRASALGGGVGREVSRCRICGCRVRADSRPHARA